MELNEVRSVYDVGNGFMEIHPVWLGGIFLIMFLSRLEEEIGFIFGMIFGVGIWLSTMLFLIFLSDKDVTVADSLIFSNNILNGM